MRASELKSFLKKAFKAGRRILIKSAPGCGKSDIVSEAAAETGMDLVLMHPSVSDPTDFKGMPAIVNGISAEFLPFGDLNKLVNATKPTLAFLDDIGQAAPAVQAALMQLILARQVNGTRISDQVVFAGATNDTKDLAAVSGMIEPLKSRWETILTLDVSVDDWCEWAFSKGLPAELVAFIRFQPQLLSDFKPTREIRNSPCPRTWAAIGSWLNDGVENLEVFTGAVGEGAAIELYSFLMMHKHLPNLDAIVLDPSGSDLPPESITVKDPSGKDRIFSGMPIHIAVASGLARKTTLQNFGRVITYLQRLPKEFEVMAVRDAKNNCKGLTSTRDFSAWAVKNSAAIL